MAHTSKVETKHFIIEHNEAEAPCIPEIVALFESKYTIITEKFCQLCAEKTEIHELVHLIIEEINAEMPRWLNEGIASEPEAIADALEDELENILPLYEVIKGNPELSDEDVYQKVYSANAE